VLVVAPTPAQARFLIATLNPGENERFEIKYDDPQRFTNATLDEYDAICLVNVINPTDEQWRQLGRYVDGGGGLAVFLGVTNDDGKLADSYKRAQAQVFLPGKPDIYTRKGNSRLRLDALDHPVFRKIREYADRGAKAVLENELEIYRFWKVEPTEDAAVLATYTDDDRSAAILSRNHGQGRTVMFTTAVDAKNFRHEWNTLTKLENSWVWLALAQPLVEHLARLSDVAYTVDAGEAVTIPLPSSDPVLLRRPNLTQTSRTPKPGFTQLIVEDTDVVGHYELARVGAGGGTTLAGFSVNPPARESDFTRLDATELDELFGVGQYQVARDIGELQSDVNLANLGKEVVSVLMVLVIVAFCGEHLVANRFYEAEADEGGNRDLGFRNPGQKAGGGNGRPAAAGVQRETASAV
jgi:hypothetical protein